MNHEQHVNCIQQAFNDMLNAISQDEWKKNKRLIKRTKTVREMFLKIPQIKKKLEEAADDMNPWDHLENSPTPA